MTNLEIAVEIGKWILIAAAVSASFIYGLKGIANADALQLRPLADELFGMAKWREEGVTKAFGTAVKAAVRGSISGQEVWLQFEADHDTDTVHVLTDYLHVFIPCAVRSTAVIAAAGMDDFVAKMFSDALSLKQVSTADPRLNGLSVRTDAGDQGIALLGNAQFNEALRGMAGTPWFAMIRVASAEKNSGQLESPSLCYQKAGMLLRLRFPRGQFQAQLQNEARWINLLAAAAPTLPA